MPPVRVTPYDVEAGLKESTSEELHKTAAIVCLGCCISVFTVYTLAALIVGFVGLAHTQHVTLDPMCPAGYWTASLGLILLRILLFLLFVALAAAAQCFCNQSVFMPACLTVFGLCVTLSMTLANTAVTAQAWGAPNCTDAVRASRDADPLLMASGSLFIMLDWIVLMVCCAGACTMCCKKCAEEMQNA